jgi:hypothetical protein
MNECRSVTPTTSECDHYLGQLEALAAKQRKRKRWYKPSIDGVDESTSEESIQVESK